jgi:hypothetical protein
VVTGSGVIVMAGVAEASGSDEWPGACVALLPCGDVSELVGAAPDIAVVRLEVLVTGKDEVAWPSLAPKSVQPTRCKHTIHHKAIYARLPMHRPLVTQHMPL